MNKHNVAPLRDVAGIAISIVLMILSLMIWMSARHFDDMSAVFPKAVSLCLAIFAGGYVIQAFVYRKSKAVVIEGSLIRRLLMFVILLAWAFCLEPLGFLLSSLLGYGSAILVANFDRWTMKSLLIYGMTGIIITGGLFLLFRYGLNVPLPSGLWK